MLPPELTIEQARARAAAYRVDVRAGLDPLGERRKSEDELTVEQAIRDWLATKTKKLSPVTAYEYRRIVQRDFIPQLGQLPLAELTRQALMTRIAAIAKRSSSMAALSFRVLGSFIHYCDAMGLTEGLTLPAAKVVAASPKPRTRRPDNGPPGRYLARL